MKAIGILALALLASCQQRTEQDRAVSNETVAPSANGAGAVAETNEAVALPDDRTPLIEPKGPIDPKSVEAAGQVIQHYAALIEQDRFTEAGNYWRDGDSAAAFAKQLQSRNLKHLEIGKPGDSEGAAGSIYLTVPVVFYGGATRSAADVILRRVNDVPGSTEAQRHWHIDRIEWKA